MIFINRTLALIKPKELFLEWLKGLPDPETMMELDILRKDCTALLIPEFTYFGQAKEYIYNHVNLIFESELKAWHEDESDWPKNRDLNMFKEWFDVEIHQQVIDFENQKYE